jgi:peptide deformylase
VEGENKPLVVLINPTIIEKEGAEKAEEGCLSLPGYTTMLNRAERVSVQGLDRNGNLIVIEGTGMLSRALQHEIDHLDGLLILDRISPIKREFFKRRFNKSRKSTASKK